MCTMESMIERIDIVLPKKTLAVLARVTAKVAGVDSSIKQSTRSAISRVPGGHFP